MSRVNNASMKGDESPSEVATQSSLFQSVCNDSILVQSIESRLNKIKTRQDRFVCQNSIEDRQKSSHRFPNNSAITEQLVRLSKNFEVLKSSANTDVWRARGYNRAAGIVSRLETDLTVGNYVSILKNQKGIGQSTLEKIGEMLGDLPFSKSGHKMSKQKNVNGKQKGDADEYDSGYETISDVVEVEEVTSTIQSCGLLSQQALDPKLLALADLQKVSGVGPSLASKLFHHLSVCNVADLRQAVAMNKVNLSRWARICLKYVEDLNERMERWEASRIAQMVRLVIELQPAKYKHRLKELHVCGSFRRRKKTLGDLDILLIRPNEVYDPYLMTEVIDDLTKLELMIENLREVDFLNQVEASNERPFPIYWIESHPTTSMSLSKQEKEETLTTNVVKTETVQASESNATSAEKHRQAHADGDGSFFVSRKEQQNITSISDDEIEIIIKSDGMLNHESGKLIELKHPLQEVSTTHSTSPITMTSMTCNSNNSNSSATNMNSNSNNGANGDDSIEWIENEAKEENVVKKSLQCELMRQVTLLQSDPDWCDRIEEIQNQRSLQVEKSNLPSNRICVVEKDGTSLEDKIRKLSLLAAEQSFSHKPDRTSFTCNTEPILDLAFFENESSRRTPFVNKDSNDVHRPEAFGPVDTFFGIVRTPHPLVICPSERTETNTNANFEFSIVDNNKWNVIDKACGLAGLDFVHKKFSNFVLSSTASAQGTDIEIPFVSGPLQFCNESVLNSARHVRCKKFDKEDVETAEMRFESERVEYVTKLKQKLFNIEVLKEFMAENERYNVKNNPTFFKQNTLAPVYNSNTQSIDYQPVRRMARRVDIKVYPEASRSFALLYFTGSSHFNRSMRSYCKNVSTSLDDYGLFPTVRVNNVRVQMHASLVAKSEKDVFDALKMEHRAPAQRDVSS